MSTYGLLHALKRGLIAKNMEIKDHEISPGHTRQIRITGQLSCSAALRNARLTHEVTV
jgi:hypothetical protein